MDMVRDVKSAKAARVGCGWTLISEAPHIQVFYKCNWLFFVSAQ